MYGRILLALDCTAADRALLTHGAELARRLGSALLLLHVADGWAARNYDRFALAESEEMQSDRRYLEETAARLRRETGLEVEHDLALGDPPTESVRAAEAARCDLIALSSHGHRLFGDLFFGSTIDKVRHRTHIPILAVRRPLEEARERAGA